MSITTVDASAGALVYNIFRVTNDRASYIGPVHSDLLKQQLLLTSIAPKQLKDSYGNRRSTLNSVSTVSVLNPAGETVSKDMKLELTASIPVGATFAQFKEHLAAIADLANDDAMMNSFFLTGKIEY